MLEVGDVLFSRGKKYGLSYKHTFVKIEKVTPKNYRVRPIGKKVVKIYAVYKANFTITYVNVVVPSLEEESLETFLISKDGLCTRKNLKFKKYFPKMIIEDCEYFGD